MSQQQTSLIYEGILELFQKTDQRIDRMAQETDRRMQEMAQETDRQMRETAWKISALGSRIGEIVENMIGGDIVAQFRALGYAVSAYYRNLIFAGAVVEPNVVQFAQKNGLYVIVQSGKAVEIIPSPEGFVAKKW